MSEEMKYTSDEVKDIIREFMIKFNKRFGLKKELLKRDIYVLGIIMLAFHELEVGQIFKDNQ